MKNYFGFTLTGKKLFPVWILFLILFLLPYLILIFKMKNIQHGSSSFVLFFPILLLLIIIAFLLTFYLTKLTIESLAFKDKSVVFNGTLGKFIGMVLLGLFLSIITFGIYSSWFIRNINRFFVNNSSYESQSFKFQGDGGKLFVILLLTIILPMLILIIAMTIFLIKNQAQASSFIYIQQLVTFIIMIPYTYFIYKWMVNIDYKDLNISWETDFWNSCGKIALEMGLSIITLGIYFPLAIIRLYKYFTNRTVASGKDRKFKFGYDMEPLNDFLFLWGQMLLTIITLSIYYPWALSKIGNRILGKTYLTEE